jgi:2-phosphosulfolactate phosphatase
VAAASCCERVLAGCLLNLDAVVAEARESRGDVLILCAGVQGEFALDDAYCAGRIAELLEGQPSDAAAAAMRLVRSFPSGEEALATSQSARNLLAAGLEGDIAWCARESVLPVVPRIASIRDAAVEVAA